MYSKDLLRGIAAVVTAVLAALASACVKYTTVSIGEKTSLERQLMGEVEPLTEEELLLTSVRAPGGLHDGSADETVQRAVQARRRQLFNRDDVDELKAKGCLGEGKGAKLVVRPCDTTRDNEQAAGRCALVASQENADRGAIIDWAIATDPVLLPKDRDHVVQVYHSLLVEQARPGDLVQDASGAWKAR